MTLVDDDEVEEVAGDGFEDFVLLVGAGEGLVEAEMDLVGGVDLAVLDFGHHRTEGLEIVCERLVSEDVAIDKEEDAFGSLGFPQPPDDLEGSVGLAGAGCHDQ